MNRIDPRRFQRFFERQRRQDRRQPAAEHGLARTGRAEEQNVVRPGGGDGQRSLDVLLSADVTEIDLVLAAVGQQGVGIDVRGLNLQLTG